jgi:ABC-2 type transport system ATP-binding protein
MSFGLSDVTVVLGNRTALAGVSVEVPRGQILAAVGGDGAGKTTMLRCLVGEITPGTGSVRRPSVNRLGYMTAGSGTWAELTVAEHFDFVGTAYRMRRDALRARRDVLIDKAGLGAARDRLARQLSGGMRHKLGFCLAILHEPEMLVLDEPSTGVDAVSRVELWQLINEAAASGAAVAISTTYLDEAERSGRVVVLDGGSCLLAGSPAEVVAHFAQQVFELDLPTEPERAWRRGRSFHQWCPEEAPAGARQVETDLEDAVVAAMIRSRTAVG